MCFVCSVVFNDLSRPVLPKLEVMTHMGSLEDLFDKLLLYRSNDQNRLCVLKCYWESHSIKPHLNRVYFSLS